MVNGIPEVQAMFRRKAAKVVAAGKAAARKGGEEVAQGMRYLAPEKSGALRRSIRVDEASTVATRAGDRGFIGVKVRAGDSTTAVTNSRGQSFQNARLQEFGTKTRPASPYFYPTWRANRSRVKGAITRAIRRAWTDG